MEPMQDVVRLFLTPEQIRLAAEFASLLSALMIGPFLAFAVTHDAGFHCPLAFLRLVQRWVLVGFSIALLYAWAYLVTNPERSPPGPVLLVLIGIFVSTFISGVRHWLAPPVPVTNTWSGFFTGARNLIALRKPDKHQRVQ